MIYHTANSSHGILNSSYTQSESREETHISCLHIEDIVHSIEEYIE